MAILADRITVTDAASEIASGRRAGEWLFTNRGANPIFVGPPGVTAATGFQVDAGEGFSIALENRETLHAVCAATFSTTLHRLAQ